jgi:hypothetical protein
MFFQLGTGDVLSLTMMAAGFEGVQSIRLATRLEYSSGEDACGAAFAGGPVALAYSRFQERVRQDVHAEYLASIDRYRTGAGYAVPGEFVVASGTRGR